LPESKGIYFSTLYGRIDFNINQGGYMGRPLGSKNKKSSRVMLQCVCGKSFEVSNYRKKKAGFCSYPCYWKSLIGKETWAKGRKMSPDFCKKISDSQKGLTGEKARSWKGGRTTQGDGYIMLYDSSNQNRYVLEHRILMEKHLKRKLFPHEIVHHRNGVKTDNRISNLKVFKSRADHARFHKLNPLIPTE
jgi:hypothetical protein